MWWQLIFSGGRAYQAIWQRLLWLIKLCQPLQNRKVFWTNGEWTWHRFLRTEDMKQWKPWDSSSMTGFPKYWQVTYCTEQRQYLKLGLVFIFKECFWEENILNILHQLMMYVLFFLQIKPIIHSTICVPSRWQFIYNKPCNIKQVCYKSDIYIWF